MHIWIVEMLIDKKWYPTIGCRLNRTDGRGELRTWKSKCPRDKFRLQKYVRANSAKLPW